MNFRISTAGKLCIVQLTDSKHSGQPPLKSKTSFKQIERNNKTVRYTDTVSVKSHAHTYMKQGA